MITNHTLISLLPLLLPSVSPNNTALCDFNVPHVTNSKFIGRGGLAFSPSLSLTRPFDTSLLYARWLLQVILHNSELLWHTDGTLYSITVRFPATQTYKYWLHYCCTHAALNFVLVDSSTVVLITRAVGYFYFTYTSKWLFLVCWRAPLNFLARIERTQSQRAAPARLRRTNLSI